MRLVSALVTWLLLAAFNDASGVVYHWEGGLCAKGQSQSPVNLENGIYDESLSWEPLNLENYEKARLAHVRNDGYTAKFTLENNLTATLSGAGLNANYIFAHLHFHWGQTSSVGSEHHQKGEMYPLEVHLVHYNAKYESLEKAASNPDGLAVLATFFQIQRGDNSQWSKLVSGLQSVKTASKRGYEVTELSLRHFIPASGSEFYRYSGSLTTPNCYESVTWTIFRQPLAISEGQMSFFRSLTNGLHQPIINNFRPLQPLNGRSILVSFRDSEAVEDYPEEPLVLATTYENDSHKLYGRKWKDNRGEDKKPKEVDHFFLLIMSIIIFFMQCGFAFMEAGAVRSKNTVNILIKNWLDMCIGALVYWAVGFALTFGDSLGRFVGTSYFFFYEMPADKLSKWFFQFVFAATAATLVSGSLAERQLSHIGPGTPMGGLLFSVSTILRGALSYT